MEVINDHNINRDPRGSNRIGILMAVKGQRNGGPDSVNGKNLTKYLGNVWIDSDITHMNIAHNFGDRQTILYRHLVTGDSDSTFKTYWNPKDPVRGINSIIQDPPKPTIEYIKVK